MLRSQETRANSGGSGREDGNRARYDSSARTNVVGELAARHTVKQPTKEEVLAALGVTDLVHADAAVTETFP